jgi:hypothetical protein
MLIVEKYEKLINYLYPILQSIPRTHGVAKNIVLSVARAKKKIKMYTKLNDAEALRKFKASWLGHIKWSNAHNLKTKLNLED